MSDPRGCSWLLKNQHSLRKSTLSVFLRAEADDARFFNYRDFKDLRTWSAFLGIGTVNAYIEGEAHEGELKTREKKMATKKTPVKKGSKLELKSAKSESKIVALKHP